jgi:hypothetical protein
MSKTSNKICSVFGDDLTQVCKNAHIKVLKAKCPTNVSVGFALHDLLQAPKQHIHLPTLIRVLIKEFLINKFHT